MGLQLQVVSKPICTKPSAFCYLSPAFLMSSVKGRQASTHLHHLLHHHLSIQHLHQFRTNPDIGQTSVGGYGVNKDPYCHKVEKVIFKNKCEPYTEKTCWTQNEEICSPVMYKNCTGVIETNIERV